MRRAAARGSSVDDEVDVVVGVGAAEQAVAHRAADEPGALVAERRADRPRSRLRHAVAVVHARDAPAEPAGDLVVDRVQAARPTPRRGSARRPARRSAPPRRRAPTSGSPGPSSTVMLSMLTVPRSGRRRPPMSTSALFGQRRGARRRRSRSGPSRASSARSRDEAPAVAGALPRRDRLDLGDVGVQLERGLEAVVGRVALERVEAVDRDAGAHEVEVRRRVAQRRGAVGGVQQRARDGARAAARPRRGSARAARRRTSSPGSSAVAKCVIAPASSRRGRRGDRVGDARGLARRRACPGGPCRCRASRARAPARGDRARRTPRARRRRRRGASSATSSSSARQRAHHEDRRVDAGRPQLGRLARPRRPRATSRRRPARRARPRAGAVAVAVGLDDGAQRGRRRRSPPAGARRCARSPRG